MSGTRSLVHYDKPEFLNWNNALGMVAPFIECRISNKECRRSKAISCMSAALHHSTFLVRHSAVQFVRDPIIFGSYSTVSMLRLSLLNSMIIDFLGDKALTHLPIVPRAGT